MRLWHKDLIPYLPRLQLIAQWRECCAICSNWANKGKPNNILVNKVMNYPKIEFYLYSRIVIEEMEYRGYKVSPKSYNNFMENYYKNFIDGKPSNNIFEGWHNERYLKQCLMNLQEKYDCGNIPENEWKIIENKFCKYL